MACTYYYFNRHVRGSCSRIRLARREPAKGDAAGVRATELLGLCEGSDYEAPGRRFGSIKIVAVQKKKGGSWDFCRGKQLLNKPPFRKLQSQTAAFQVNFLYAAVKRGLQGVKNTAHRRV